MKTYPLLSSLASIATVIAAQSNTTQNSNSTTVPSFGANTTFEAYVQSGIDRVRANASYTDAKLYYINLIGITNDTHDVTLLFDLPSQSSKIGILNSYTIKGVDGGWLAPTLGIKSKTFVPDSDFDWASIPMTLSRAEDIVRADKELNDAEKNFALATLVVARAHGDNGEKYGIPAGHPYFNWLIGSNNTLTTVFVDMMTEAVKFNRTTFL